MLKQEFLEALRSRLRGLPREDVEERLGFYSEMIEDRIEEGLAEQDAVAAIGSVEQIAGQILSDIPLARLAMEKIRPKRRLGVWEILLLALGSPIWISLLAAAFAVMLSVYVSLWSVVVSVWAVFASLAACAVGGVVAGVPFAFLSNPFTGAAAIAAGICCAGLAVFLFFGSKATTKGMLLLTKKIALGLKKCFITKEGASC